MRLKIIIILLSIFALIITGCTQSFQPGTLTDDMGRQIKIDKPPQRIVSHIPSITEILFALDLGDRVVGVDSYSNYPEAAKSKPQVGNYFNPSIENIVAVNPDLVFTDGLSTNTIIESMDNLKIPYIVLQPKNIEGIFKNIELVGRVTGVENKATEVIKDMRSRMSAVTERVKGAPPPRVFYIFDSTDLTNPWTAGPGSFVDTLIALAGGSNIGAEALAPWAPFTIERIVKSDPEIIIFDAMMGTATTSKQKLESHPVWQKLAAVKQGKIYTIDGDMVNRSGPRIVQGLEELAKIIHPELIK